MADGGLPVIDFFLVVLFLRVSVQEASTAFGLMRAMLQGQARHATLNGKRKSMNWLACLDASRPPMYNLIDYNSASPSMDRKEEEVMLVL
jgi:hypothetical protein